MVIVGPAMKSLSFGMGHQPREKVTSNSIVPTRKFFVAGNNISNMLIRYFLLLLMHKNPQVFWPGLKLAEMQITEL